MTLAQRQDNLTGAFQELAARGQYLGDRAGVVGYLDKLENPVEKARITMWFCLNAPSDDSRNTAFTILAETTSQLVQENPAASARFAGLILAHDPVLVRREGAWGDLEESIRRMDVRDLDGCVARIEAACRLIDFPLGLVEPNEKKEAGRRLLAEALAPVAWFSQEPVQCMTAYTSEHYRFSARGDVETARLFEKAARLHLTTPEKVPHELAVSLALWLDGKNALVEGKSEVLAARLLRAAAAKQEDLNPLSLATLCLAAYRLAPEGQCRNRAKNMAARALRAVEMPQTLIHLHERHADDPAAQGIVSAAIKARAENGLAEEQLKMLEALTKPWVPYALVSEVVLLSPSALTQRLNRLFQKLDEEERHASPAPRGRGSLKPPRIF